MSKLEWAISLREINAQNAYVHVMLDNCHSASDVATHIAVAIELAEVFDVELEEVA